MDNHGTEPGSITRTDGEMSGEFATGEYQRASAGEKTATHRKRRRRSKKRKKLAPMLTMIGVGLFCFILVSVGILVGLSYSEDQGDAERYRQALEAREAAHSEWMTECSALGFAEWTCNRFDRVHFQKAKDLDSFRCRKKDGTNLHQCEYKLGTAEVLVSLPEPFEVNGQFLAPRERAHAVIGHSDIDDRHYVAISEKGHIELRTRDDDSALYIINPSNGSLNALHEGVRPDQ
jgi:hypothetical protein